MDNEARFSASDLAEIVKVPRTTINDWISRYSQYIDFKLQGKRKIYTQASVNVLKEIAELRDKGLSSFDIENELAKRHPVHAEQLPPITEQPAQQDSTQEAAPGENQQPADSGNEDYALIVKKQTDEIGRLIGEQLLNMSKRLEDLEHANRLASAKTSKYYILTVFLIFIFAIMMAAAAFQLASSMQENKNLKSINTQYSTDLSKSEQELEKITFRLNDNKERFEGNIKKLQSQMEDQKKEFDNSLKTQLGDAEQKKEAEMRQLRDKFAEERLELLKKLEAAAQAYSADQPAAAPVTEVKPAETPAPAPAAPLP